MPSSLQKRNLAFTGTPVTVSRRIHVHGYQLAGRVFDVGAAAGAGPLPGVARGAGEGSPAARARRPGPRAGPRALSRPQATRLLLPTDSRENTGRDKRGPIVRLRRSR